MTQDEVNKIFAITISIHEDEYFGKKGKRLDREKAQAWVSKQLADSFGVYTVPVGSSWGSIVDKEYYDEYWEDKYHMFEGGVEDDDVFLEYGVVEERYNPVYKFLLRILWIIWAFFRITLVSLVMLVSLIPKFLFTGEFDGDWPYDLWDKVEPNAM